jgi:hypothetical protein
MVENLRPEYYNKLISAETASRKVDNFDSFSNKDSESVFNNLILQSDIEQLAFIDFIVSNAETLKNNFKSK